MAKECSNSSCNKSSCEGCGQKQPQSLMAEPNVFSDVKHVIGAVSGKGGVGKSFVTGSLANLMASKGYKSGHYGCGYHRSVHPEDVWHQG